MDMEAIIRNIDALSRALRAEHAESPPNAPLGTLLISLTASTKQMEHDLTKARRAMKRFRKGLKRMARER